MSISGKYVNVGQEGFKEYMDKRGSGRPTPGSGADRERKFTVEFSLNGNKVTRTTLMDDDPEKSFKNEFVIGQEFEEKRGSNTTVKSIAKLEGNVLTIESKTDDGSEIETRVHKFTDSGLEVFHKSTKAGEAKSIFKRL